MDKKRPSIPLTLLGAASALALGANDAPAQTGSKAGVAAAVKGAVQQVSFRTPQSTVGRNVTSGDEIFLGDRIVTGPGGGLQIMLMDGTTFSVGPNSSMVIDEFVYNPADGSGKLTASITRGTMRLISGRIGRQEQEAIRIKLPVATVGIRGTMSLFAGGPESWSVILGGIGPDNQMFRTQSYLVVEINGVKYEIFRTGWGCVIVPGGTCEPKPVDQQFIQTLIGAIQGEFRFVDLGQLENLTGLDLKLLYTDFEQLWTLINKLYQDQSRPGEFTPPPPPPPGTFGD